MVFSFSVEVMSIAVACILGMVYCMSFSAIIILSLGSRAMKSAAMSPLSE